MFVALIGILKARDSRRRQTISQKPSPSGSLLSLAAGSVARKRAPLYVPYRALALEGGAGLSFGSSGDRELCPLYKNTEGRGQLRLPPGTPFARRLTFLKREAFRAFLELPASC